MSVEDEVLSIRKQLEKMTEAGQDQSQALDLLKALSRVKMNLTILTNTRIGMAVNSLRWDCLNVTYKFTELVVTFVILVDT